MKGGDRLRRDNRHIKETTMANDTLKIYRTTNNGGNEFVTAFIKPWSEPEWKDIQRLEETGDSWECALILDLGVELSDAEVKEVLFYTNDIWMEDGKYALAARIKTRLQWIIACR